MKERLGGKKPNHSIDQLDTEQAKIGEDLIYHGRTTIDTKKTKRISTYFVCTDCHNLTREFDDISSQSSEERLAYARKNGLPFLPGSTLWGIYNRTSFYNGDYSSKYGDLVVNARDSLKNAVQLCAKYCSSGRYLEDWELESIMHYFKQHELKLKDLNLSSTEQKGLLYYQQLDEDEKKQLLEKLNQRHVQAYNATFLPAMDVNVRKFGEGGDPEKGEVIYRKACLYCHKNKRVTYLHLDEDKLSARMFWKNIGKYNNKSLYQIIRYGTHSKAGRRQYMPNYTKEKMSDEQLNDLVAYIKQLAEK